MTRVKVCGVRSREIAQQLETLPIDYVGFVFATGSRRLITPTFARELASFLPERIRRVGVFVDSSPTELQAIIDEAGLSVVQLQGNESPDVCRAARHSGAFVWKAWPVRGEEYDQNVTAYADCIDGLLLDTYKAGVAGGTGQTFPWESIRFFQRWLPHVPIVVAGGLSPGNVGALIQQYRPSAVDVSSGIEVNGAQNFDQIKQFIEKVGKADAISG